MDVRCEKCQVEYELEDSKLKPGGVTVKCANCGHMFRIRKRSPRSTRPGTGKAAPAFDDQVTSERPALRADETTKPNAYSQRAAPPAPFPPADKTPPPERLPAPPAAPSSGKSGRKWLIRLETGEVQTCRELATLQKWIVAGMVTRKCHISRTGKTWKPLGQISELKMFFDIAEEARHARAQSQGAPVAGPSPRTRRPTGSKPPPLPPSRAHRKSGPSEPLRGDAAQKPRLIGEVPPAEAGERSPDSQADALAATLPRGVADAIPEVVERAESGGREAAVASNPARRPGAVAKEASERVTGGWAVNAKLAESLEGEQGPSGPVGGLAKGVPTADVLFAANAKQVKMKPAEPELGGRVEPLPSDFDDDDFQPASGGLGKWIVLGSLVVLLGAAAVVYLLVFREGGSKKAAAAHDAAAELAASSATGVTDGGASGPKVSSAADATAIEDARQAILADDTSALVSILPRLEAAAGADTDRELLVLRSRIEATLAQQLLDRAEVNSDNSPDAAKELRREAESRMAAAAKHAEKALATSADDPPALIAMADALRLQGKKAREVKRWLQKAGDDREAKLVEAMLDLRENKVRSARSLLTALDSDDALEKTGDVRPRYRLALIAFNAKDYAKARDAADAVLAVQPGHAGAAVLVERIRAATQVATSDPMPPEVKHSSSSGGGGDTYDSLLERANKKAESGQCSAAMPLYQRALDLNPSGVAALTGLGYCHLDAAQFASAQAKFRAALGISPRYQEALLGVAEGYQQQGLKEKAIAAYERFIEEHPASARAAQAKRQIEKLGGLPPSGGGASSTSGDETPTSGDTTGGEASGANEGGSDSSGAADVSGGSGGDESAGDSADESKDDSADEPKDDSADEPKDDSAAGDDESSAGPGAAALDDLSPSPKPPAAKKDDGQDD